jgi:hypothetical protein
MVVCILQSKNGWNLFFLEKKEPSISIVCVCSNMCFYLTFIFQNINAANIGMLRFLFRGHAGKATYRTRVRNPAIHIQPSY